MGPVALGIVQRTGLSRGGRVPVGAENCDRNAKHIKLIDSPLHR